MNILYTYVCKTSPMPDGVKTKTKKLFQGEMHNLIGLLDMRSMVPECNGPTRTMSHGSAATCLIIVSYGPYIAYIQSKWEG